MVSLQTTFRLDGPTLKMLPETHSECWTEKYNSRKNASIRNSKMTGKREGKMQ